jgi:hypothetical protein
LLPALSPAVVVLAADDDEPDFAALNTFILSGAVFVSAPIAGFLNAFIFSGGVS